MDDLLCVIEAEFVVALAEADLRLKELAALLEQL